MTELLVVVAAALFDSEDRVLLAQRPEGKSMAGLWEFPGGKIEAGETPEIALARELFEELGITVDPKNLKPMKFASFSYPKFHLLMPLYACRAWEGIPVGAEEQSLNWVKLGDLHRYDAPAADIPLFDHLASYGAQE